MPSVIPNKLTEALARGQIDFDNDDFKVMLLTSAYVPNGDTHQFRSDLTNEVAAGGGYTAGGWAAVVTVARDDATNRVDVSLGAINRPSPTTITARFAVYYKARGGPANQDELVAIIDFGVDKISTNAAFQVAASTLRMQNP